MGRTAHVVLMSANGSRGKRLVAVHAVARVPGMERSILALLEQHESLGFDQIVVQLREPPNAVRSALTDLRERGFVSVFSIGEIEGHVTAAASYWRLTDAGRGTWPAACRPRRRGAVQPGDAPQRLAT